MNAMCKPCGVVQARSFKNSTVCSSISSACQSFYNNERQQLIIAQVVHNNSRPNPVGKTTTTARGICHQRRMLLECNRRSSPFLIKRNPIYYSTAPVTDYVITTTFIWSNRHHYDNNNQQPYRGCGYSTSILGGTTKIYENEHVEALYNEQNELVNEAKILTLSFYRTVVRSIRIIREGNEYDDAEFTKREVEQLQALNDTASSTLRGGGDDTRFNMISMLPPVNRDDELRSRAEYYLQYAHENIQSEAYCLQPPPELYGIENTSRSIKVNLWYNEHNVLRYLSLLQRGYEQHQWLLTDMKFIIPKDTRIKITNEKLKIENFKTKALNYIRRVQEYENQQQLQQQTRNDPFSHLNRNKVSSCNTTKSSSSKNRMVKNDDANDDDDDNADGWYSDDDDRMDDDSNKRTLPEWYKNPRSY